jgi:hypothetical protein
MLDGPWICLLCFLAHIALTTAQPSVLARGLKNPSSKVGGGPTAPSSSRTAISTQSWDACKEDIDTFCGNLTDFGPTFMCMIRHSSELAPDCKNMLDELIPEVESLFQACQKSISNVCPHASLDARRVAEDSISLCLVDHVAELEPECLSYMQKILRQILFPSAAKDAAPMPIVSFYQRLRAKTVMPPITPGFSTDTLGAPPASSSSLLSFLILVSVALFLAVVTILVQYACSVRAKRRAAMNARLSEYFASVGHPELYPADGGPRRTNTANASTPCHAGAACKSKKDVKITVESHKGANKSVRFGAASEKQVEMTKVHLSGSAEIAPTDSFRRSLSV